jgi:hypothetical protein
MKLSKRIISLLLSSVLLLSCVGCAECISTEYTEVSVTIVNEYHCASRVRRVWTGKSFAMTTYPAQYKITVDYDGIEYTFDDKELYDKYKDKIGQTATGELEIKTYDDGTVTYDITSIY